ncbi:MAG: helix-turn-helix transcriptional regulator [Bosea sp. (in: a-proteobacteria)]|uniref:helix-turn-helix domain-containing protein n=1 Tax=Bosea sp. (in: a-proteobacteria) TaxID=1871050 RepID=UPI0027360BD1|nr:helix-turn-helix transcriptional regulator [Bosea sp. (in: a-proteobacteria)]MDP3255214.1 helix-turn-helix transcriptional regulator [Bosea sp. (in: a-proteobacteria)]MDP3319706.1 helix-turn-helix transcriptional regulator [Bosea sp. (in: a-proteobacteria)]
MIQSKPQDDEQAIDHGIGNVFADLGLSDRAERQTKTRLALAINEMVSGRKLRQAETGRLLGLPQSKVSAVVNYRLDGFSVERLMTFLTRFVIRTRRGEPMG